MGEDKLNQRPDLMYNNQVQDLPGSTRYSVDGGAGEMCTYWVVDSFTSVETVGFYNVCSNKDTGNIISA